MIGDLTIARPTTRPVTGARRPGGHRIVDAAAAVVGLGLGAVVAMAINDESGGALRARGGTWTFLGQIAGLTGTYLMLVMLLLVARIPWVERAVGQDRLVRWHRRLGQWPIYLIGLHAVAITVGYAQAGRVGVMTQLRQFLGSYPDVLAGTVALVLIVAAAVASIRAARRRMSYETWWVVHLYMYLALALAFSHQIANGQSFVGHPLARVFWATLWAVTAGVVLVFRVLLPVGRTIYHDLRVVGVVEEAPGVVSVVCRGRHLEGLGIQGGQFFQWRFLTRGMWWHAHPYSLSALPRRDMVRFTVKQLGDHSAGLARLPAGTRVAIEGPYGAFTGRNRTRDRLLLIGAGVGVTPVRALLEHLDPRADVTVLIRASSPDDVLFHEEFDSLVRRFRRGRLEILVGSRRKHPLHARQLRHLVPDIAERDIYVCGPEPLNQSVIAAAVSLGVNEKSIHCEQFAF